MQLATRARQQLPRTPKTEKRTSRSRDVFELREPDSFPVEEEKGEKSDLIKITTKMKRHVKHVLKDENPTVWVGKEGFTPELSSEIEKQLQRSKMVKVKILQSALQTETAQAIAAKAAEQTDAALVEVRGHVFILYRRLKKQPP